MQTVSNVLLTNAIEDTPDHSLIILKILKMQIIIIMDNEKKLLVSMNMSKLIYTSGGACNALLD